MVMLILASNSPRRKELLSMLGYTFEVRPANCDEFSRLKNPKKLVKELSLRKAKAVAKAPNDVVIGSDTVVAFGRQILGKPRNKEEAFRMLSQLSGRSHTVHTGVTILNEKTCITKCVSCKVIFRRLSANEIQNYIATGDVYDKAGAYGIQGPASAFVKRINGDYFAVMGFPCSKVDSLLKKLGITPTLFQ